MRWVQLDGFIQLVVRESFNGLTLASYELWSQSILPEA